VAATAARSGTPDLSGQASRARSRTSRPPPVISSGASHQSPGIGRPAPTTEFSSRSRPETEATAPIVEIIPETSATAVTAQTAVQPWPYTRDPSVMPTAPNSWGIAMLRMRMR